MERSRAYRLVLFASPEPEPDAAAPEMTIIYLFVDDPGLESEPEPAPREEPDAHAIARRDHLRLLPPPDSDAEPGFLAPLFFPGKPIDGAGERWLTNQAHAARDGQPGAFDLLHQALEPRLARWAEFRALRLRAAGPLRDGRPWLLDDLQQEGYFVLRATLESWPGQESFLPWLLAVAPKRMHNAWRALLSEHPAGTPIEEEPVADDPELTAVDSSRLVQDCLALLVPDDARLLLVYLQNDGSLPRAGQRLGLGRGAMQYRLRRIFARLHTVLSTPAQTPPLPPPPPPPAS